MASLLQTNTKKAAVDPLTEKVMKARAGHAAFDKTMAAQAAVKSEAPAPRAFLSGLGGTSNAPKLQTVTQARKADALSSLPPAARAKAERFDADTQGFVNLVYQRHQETKEAVAFTFAEAGSVMKCDQESARRRVEALTSNGLLRPAYSSLGTLTGYTPGHTE